MLGGRRFFRSSSARLASMEGTPEGQSRKDMLRRPESGHSPSIPSQSSVGPGFLFGWAVRRGSTCTMLEVRASLFTGRVRAVFDNPVACNRMAGRDRPRDEAPSPGRACEMFQPDQSRWFSGLSRLASGQNHGGSRFRRCYISEIKPNSAQRGLP
jgi:hypothetical protein